MSDENEKIKALTAEIRLLKKKLDTSNYARQRIETLKDMNQRLLENVNTELSVTLNKLKATQENLNRAKLEAESANKIKSEFLANMSHELRTPLNAIIGYSEMLLEETDDPALTKFSPDIAKIIASAKHLLTLINDVLDLSKIEAGKLEIFLEDISIHSVMKELEAMILPLVEKNKNKFVLKMNQSVDVMHTDIVKLRQCLLNLLSNSSKFTKNGLITLEISSFKKDKREWVKFSVTDNGIGLTQEQLGKLFHAFSQADTSTTRKYGGTGLGLYLTLQYTEMLGGTISVVSEYNKGSTFDIILPVKSAVGITRSDFVSKSQEAVQVIDLSHTKTILVIDDDPAIHHQMNEILASNGYNVLHALTSDEGLHLAREYKPDVITLDVIMPSMDGWGILSALKSNSALADIPTILVTVINEEELGFALGACDYIHKPIQASILLNKIEQCLNKPKINTVLIVDDELSVVRVLTKMVEKAGWKSIHAMNGREAIELLAYEQPSLILLDLMMPDMDGFAMIEALQGNDIWRKIPVVIVTGKDLSGDERNLLMQYSKSILQKGTYTRKQLISVINSFVKTPVISMGGLK